ncbi:hypothetical protein TNCV_1107871 [Trichonephila clavipes]|nr:hypothetical protein TNCV_1107871 [Trichonephila clavipes]
MDTQTLLRLAHSDYKIKRTFGGVFASDILPEKRGHYRSFIVNTDSSMSTESINDEDERNSLFGKIESLGAFQQAHLEQ